MGESYKELIAWQKAMDLAATIFEVTARFPREQMYVLAAQLQRAALSVPSNIAEGQARYSQREFYRFLSTARGSLAEVETQLLIAQRLGFLNKTDAARLLSAVAELSRILNALAAAIKQRAFGLRAAGAGGTEN